MKTFTKRIDSLRSEIIRAIKQLYDESLETHHYEPFLISELVSEPTFVVWADRHGELYDCRVTKVDFDNGILMLYVENDNFEESLPIDSRYEIGTRNLDCLNGVYENMLETLKIEAE